MKDSLRYREKVATAIQGLLRTRNLTSEKLADLIDGTEDFNIIIAGYVNKNRELKTTELQKIFSVFGLHHTDLIYESPNKFLLKNTFKGNVFCDSCYIYQDSVPLDKMIDLEDILESPLIATDCQVCGKELFYEVVARIYNYQ